jgi:hypothetical protein
MSPIRYIQSNSPQKIQVLKPTIINYAPQSKQHGQHQNKFTDEAAGPNFNMVSENH